jgi:membrane protease YdiL (CAAX protease family)
MTLSYENPETRARADHGRHAWWRYLVTLVWSFFVQIAVAVVVFIIVILGGVPAATLIAASRSPAQPLWFFTIVGVSFAGWLVGIWSGAWIFNKKPARDFLAGWRWPLFFAGVAIWLAVSLGDAGLDYVLKPSGFILKASLTPAVVAVVALGIAVQTFAEEFVFRGYATQGFLHLMKRPVPAAVLSGLLFGVCHIPNGWIQAINAAVLGVVLALIAIKTGSLAFGYGLHLVNNLFGALVVVSADDVFKGAPGLFAQATPSLDLLDLAVSVIALGVLAFAFGRRPSVQ